MNDSITKGELRRQQIMLRLKQHGRITIQEIVADFECSEATARRDLDLLERRGELLRTIGGAIYEGSGIREATFTEKKQMLWLEKEAIAELAASLVEEGDSVCLTGGTTTYLIAKALKLRSGITIVTNAVNIAMELADSDGIQVILIGGVMRGNTYELTGPLALRMIQSLNIGKLFMGIDGLSIANGITTYSELEAETARLLLERAEAAYAVFDHTKLGKSSLFTVGELAALKGIVTDQELPQDMELAVQEAGIQRFIAKARA